MRCTTRRLREIVGQVRGKTFPYVRRPRTRVPWSLYTRAQTHELPDMLALIRRVVEVYEREHPPPSPVAARKGGRPPIPRADRVKTLLVQSYLTLPNRPTQGHVTVLRGALDLERPRIGYKTVERSYGDPAVVQALQGLLEITNRPVQSLEIAFAADGTGSPTTVGQHYRSARARQEERGKEQGLLPHGDRSWVYNVATVGVRYGLIAGWVSWTDRTIGEISQFSELARQWT